MTLTRKFIVSLILSILFIFLINIVSFYIFYSLYLKVYFVEKKNNKDSITLEYINNIIQKQTIDEIDSIFTDTEIEFFELLEINSWEIPINKTENIDIVINYLVKSWVTPKYIEELIPTDNFWKVLDAIKDKQSPEYRFINRLTVSILVVNLFSISLLIIILLFYIRKTVLPIKQATSDIKKIKLWNEYTEIDYINKNDEIWLIITAINWLNKKLNLQETIRTRLLADISHELKTPITSIQCYLEWISDWVIKLNQKNLNSISSEMNRLVSLVNKIMDYEKSERKKLLLDFNLNNISDFIKEIVETHKKKLKENKQRIKVTWDEKLELAIDNNLFKQLVHNLIWNFFKYAWKKSILKVNITKRYIDFNDNWIWIKMSEIPFLTEKFYQWNIEKTWDIDSRWIWVWLSITKRIIESHGWKYDIKSDLWKWFSFKIYL